MSDPDPIPSTTVITTTTVDMLTISQVCRRYPGARGNARMNPSTVPRWILKGCPSRSGVRVKLRATRAGGRWLIAPEALDEFFAALASTAPEAVPTAAVTPRRTENERSTASALAAKNLVRRGA